ncbi:iron uptake transporter deferrochelatase/peroxidase subunit [Actinophytocola sp.]|uniref:iron uptake transporter deferrochelatase/peroxidase subunit n=1 Tax=Actinophytocola sp. TaxID=1872138 RepID=UPI002D409E45|nr:iron uptake transporter deferrochelatase/peroxidase subunit [Actinophytocola sp.]HYQ62334.1 iron uptake transporter deferrochelatase/peroxidase subunit [Actinophytocola sp.]
MTLSRRRLLGVVGAGAAVAGAGAAAGVLANEALTEAPVTQTSGAAEAVPFYGRHQAGIVTPAQDRMHFVALDVTTTDRAELVQLLKDWTVAAERMTRGLEAKPDGAVGGLPDAAPADTGEALDLAASALTLTIGFGASLFDDRFGAASKLPPALAPLPRFPADDLDPARSGGDICVQACANDPQVAVHAIRNLVRLGFGKVAVRWSQLGFGRTSSTSKSQVTPRNLFGFKDGTRNLKAEESDLLTEHVWVAKGDGPDWLADGTYLVARRIRMHIEIWDRTPLSEQEAIVGRAKGTGAPLGQVAEYDEPDLHVRGEGGIPVIAEDAHIRLASAENLKGARILRRGYNFTDGTDGLGHLDAGLFFIGFNRDSRKQFVPMQQALSSKDSMMEYVEHTGSGLFAVPPGLSKGGYWGDTLFT